jgi:DNA polymerase I-like protein with 3'-5' exonuclease and polymerase domains
MSDSYDKPRTLRIARTPTDLEIILTCAQETNLVAVDTETTALDPIDGRLRLVQFCFEAEDELIAWVVDTWKFTAKELGDLAAVFWDPEIVKVAHNAKFEIKWITTNIIQPWIAQADPNEVGSDSVCRSFFCTEIASRIVSAGEISHKHSLAAVTQRYLGIERDKTLQTSDWSAPELSDEQIQYAVDDVYDLLQLRRLLVNEILKNDLSRVMVIEMDCLLPVAEMELAGLKLDREAWTALLEQKTKDRDAKLIEVTELFQPGVNWTDDNPEKKGKRPVQIKKWFKQPRKPKLYTKTECKGDPALALKNLVMIEEFQDKLIAFHANEWMYETLVADWQQRFDAWNALPAEITATINLRSPKRVQQAMINLGVPLGDRKTNEKELNELVNDIEPQLYNLKAQLAAAAAKGDDKGAQMFIEKNVMSVARYEHWLKIINDLLDYRGLDKSVTSYGKNWLRAIKPDGRIHPNIKQLQADTGRMSSGGKDGDEAAINIQNLPHDPAHRSCIVAPDGKDLLIADYAQIELRILLELSGDTNFAKDFNSGLDMHTKGASRFFRVEYEAVTKALRQNAKAVNFLVIYGGGEFTLSARIKSTTEEAKELLNNYFESYPGNKVYMDKAAHQAMNKGFARTMTGRMLVFDLSTLRFLDARDAKRRLKGYGRNGMNMPIQGSSADMIKRALYLLGEKLRKIPGAYVITCVHDEIVVECFKEDTPRVSAILKEAMEQAGTELLTLVPCPVDVTIGRTWADKK